MKTEVSVLMPCPPHELSRLCQALAMLDAILMPEWSLRCYSFDAHWGKGEMLASMRSGGADHFFVLLNSHGAFIKGYSAEARAEPRPDEVGLFEAVPAEFHDVLHEPAFDGEQTTFCLWATQEGGRWRSWPSQAFLDCRPGGAHRLLSILDRNPRTYQDWAEKYYGRALAAWAIDAVYDHEPLGPELVHALNPNRTIADLAQDIREIGYPSALPR